MGAIEDHLDGLDEIKGAFRNGQLDDDIVDWFTSQESGESDCGLDVTTLCQVEWLESECPATAQSVFQGSIIIEDFDANDSPNGMFWTWEQCAKECYDHSSGECEFWFRDVDTCRLAANVAGIYLRQNSMQVTGYKSVNCDGVSESCKASCREIMRTKLEDVEAEWRALVEANEVCLHLLCLLLQRLFLTLNETDTHFSPSFFFSVSSSPSTCMYTSI